MGLALSSCHGAEIIRRNVGLLEDSGERAEFQLAVQGDHASSRTPFEYDMATVLPCDMEAEFFQRAYDLSA